MRKTLGYILIILCLFLFSCKTKESYKVVYNESGYELSTFSLSELSIRKVENGKISYTIVNSDMLSASDNAKLTSVGTYEITINYLEYSEVITLILYESENPKPLPTTLESLKITNFSLTSYYVGNTKKIEYSYLPTTATIDISYYSSNENVAIVSKDGYVIFLAKGDALIKVVNNVDKKELDSISLTVSEKELTLASYYDTIGDVSQMTGEELKTILHNLIDDHVSGSYALLKTILPKSDQDPNNKSNMILFYTGRSQGGEIGSSGDEWNREHVWPISKLGDNTSLTAGHDAHHIRPTDASVNGVRANLDFDEGGSLVKDTYGSGSTYCYYDSDSFEPRDEVKGDVARMLFYMATRYEGDISGEMDLEIITNKIGGVGKMGNLAILLKWNEEDPVDDFERNRNDVIYSYQSNKNPFIDHPEYVNIIWSI